MNETFESLMTAVFDLLGKAGAPPAEWFFLTPTWTAITGGVVKSIYEYVGIFAIGLTLVYFLFELNEKIAFEGRDLNMKSFFAPFLKLVMAFGLISQSGKIAGLIIKFNDTFMGAMTNTYSPIVNTAFRDAFIKQGEISGFFIIVFAMLIGIVMMILSLVLQLVWGFKAVMYKLEVLFRLAILPIAISDVYQGSHSNALRYLKGFLALGIVGVSMVTLPKLASEVAAAAMIGGVAVDASGSVTIDGEAAVTIWSFFKGLGSMIVAPFAAIAATSVCKQLAKEALGC